MPAKLHIEPGQVFGERTVIREVERRGNQRYVLCRCSCGKEQEVNLYALRSGASHRCASCSLTGLVKLGQRFGERIVLKELESRQGDRYFSVQCSCGDTQEVPYTSLKRSTTCMSCAQRDSAPDLPIGTKVGRWTVVDESVYVQRKRKLRKVPCRCECGTEKLIGYHTLRDRGTRGCKLCTRATENSLRVGDVVGEWTLLERLSQRKNNTYFRCRCSCGNEGDINASSLRQGKSKKCRDCHKTAMRAPRNRGPLGHLWGKLVHNASARGIEFDLEQQAVFDLFHAQGGLCALSGVSIELGTSQNNRGTASLDRVDSQAGYTPDNVQWVHRDVNLMKNALKQDYFIKLCRAVAGVSRAGEADG